MVALSVCVNFGGVIMLIFRPMLIIVDLFYISD